MHYRHSYHAGNFADVFKHAVLCGLLAALSRKDKPWVFIDSHAGAGAYDLSHASATRTGEWRDGIGRLYALRDTPAPLTALLETVRALNHGGALERYPGSPLIARALARAGDRLMLCEKVPEVAAELAASLTNERRATVQPRDGYEAHTLLPLPEKRGLLLIDPPFERPDEFDAVAELMAKARARFAGGVLAAWYPLKNRHAAGRFERRVARDTEEPPLRLTLETGARGEGQMRACALLIVNAPYGFAEAFETTGRLLASVLAQGPHARYDAGQP